MSIIADFVESKFFVSTLICKQSQISQMCGYHIWTDGAFVATAVCFRGIWLKRLKIETMLIMMLMMMTMPLMAKSKKVAWCISYIIIKWIYLYMQHWYLYVSSYAIHYMWIDRGPFNDFDELISRCEFQRQQMLCVLYIVVCVCVCYYYYWLCHFNDQN